MQKNTKAFNENLSIILEELHLAAHWERASIILTIHKDIFSQAKTKYALNKKFKKLGNKLIEIEINNFEENFIEYLFRLQKIDNTIIFISNIDWGGGEDDKDFYRILNFHRETLVERRIKAVFFLTRQEASNLANYAPDFWAFRHRVLEFSSPSARNKKKPPVGIMLWQLDPFIFQDIDSENNISDLITRLNGIPEQPEAIALRIDTKYELGYLCWQKGDLGGAEKTLEEGLELAKVYNIKEVRPKLINGLAIINYERGNYQKALDLLEPLVKENPRDCLLILNHAISLFALNKRYVALKKGIKAKNLCAKNPWIVSSLGFLYFFAGKMEEAIECYQNAVDISPTTYIFNEALVVCYLTMRLQEKATVQLEQAKKYLVGRKLFYNILKAFIEDEKEIALQLFKEAIDSGKITNKVFVREPTLFALFDSSEGNPPLKSYQSEVESPGKISKEIPLKRKRFT